MQSLTESSGGTESSDAPTSVSASHVGTLAFSIDKDGNEKINLYNISAVACNAM